jgi:mRNA interferase RelE/StbE
LGKNVIWKEQANAQLRALDQPTALRILHALAHYLETGEGDVKRLQNIEPPEFRLRIGDYRVRFHDEGDTIRITAVKHRREAYR